MLRLIHPIFRTNQRIISQKYIKPSSFDIRKCSLESKNVSSNDVLDDIREHKIKTKAVEKIDKETLELLERLSLVNIEDE